MRREADSRLPVASPANRRALVLRCGSSRNAASCWRRADRSRTAPPVGRRSGHRRGRSARTAGAGRAGRCPSCLAVRPVAPRARGSWSPRVRLAWRSRAVVRRTPGSCRCRPVRWCREPTGLAFLNHRVRIECCPMRGSEPTDDRDPADQCRRRLGLLDLHGCIEQQRHRPIGVGDRDQARHTVGLPSCSCVHAARISRPRDRSRARSSADTTAGT